MTLLDTVKTVFILALLLYTAPRLVEGIKKQYIPILEGRTNIGIVRICQPILNATTIMEGIHSFLINPAIKGIILKIDCSDFAPGTCQTIFHDIRQLKKEFPKPIITLIENSCIAGAYLIATASDYIIAPESAIIGGIGPDFIAHSRMHMNSKYNFEHIEQESYEQLTKHIALARKLSLSTVANWAEGKIFTGNQARALGLINEIGGMCIVTKIIKEKALIENDIEWIEYCSVKTVFDIFFCNNGTKAHGLQI